ncbi:MAG: CoA pyrophosphatase [Anaerolineaceae bacterium]|nr:CoA pyrophosphatase [Anaerolineaceae bacterium]
MLQNNRAKSFIDKIRERLNTAAYPVSGQYRTGDSQSLRRAAVLILLTETPEGWSLLYTRRSDLLEKHKGQVAFPGGGADDDDACLEETAKREAREEIGLPASCVEIIGRMPDRSTVTDYLVAPIVGVVTHPFTYQISEQEVARVFTIPLAWLADRSHYQVRSLVLSGGREDGIIVYDPYDGETVWGFTGRLTVDFLDTIGLFPD